MSEQSHIRSKVNQQIQFGCRVKGLFLGTNSVDVDNYRYIYWHIYTKYGILKLLQAELEQYLQNKNLFVVSNIEIKKGVVQGRNIALSKYTSLVNGRGSEKYIIIAKLLNNEKGNVIAYKILDFYGNIRVISKKELQIYSNENLIVNASIAVKNGVKYVKAVRGSFVQTVIQDYFNSADGIEFQNKKENNTKSIIYYTKDNCKKIKTKETKRILYYSILDDLTKEQDIFSNINVFSIQGIRRVGKTTILQQLYNVLDSSMYIDCTFLCNNEDINIPLLFGGIQEKGIKYVLLDEVCKLNEKDKQQLIYYLKSEFKDIKFVITGSVVSEVQRISNLIGDSKDYYLDSYLYIEYLMFQQSNINYESNPYNIGILKKLTTYEHLCEYLKTNNRYLNVNFMERVIQDTLVSYIGYVNRTQNDFSKEELEILSTLLNDSCKLQTLMDYVAINQYIKLKQRKTNTEAESLNTIGRGDSKATILDKLVYNKRKDLEVDLKRIKKEDYNIFMKLLLKSRICLKATVYTSGNPLTNTSVQINIDLNNDLYPLLFVYNGFTLFTYNQNLDSYLINYWLENLILKKAVQCYGNSGKYRYDSSNTGENLEIDVLYSIHDIDNIGTKVINGIEVKGGKASNTSNTKYSKLVKNLNLGEFIRLCNDIEYKVIEDNSNILMRSDICVILLEFLSIHQEDISVNESYRKYWK